MEQTFALIKRNLLYLSSLLIVAGSFIDIFTLVADNHTKLINSITILVILLSTILFAVNILSIKVSFGIVLYTTVLNFIASSFYEISLETYADNFVLNSLYFGMMIPLIGFVVNKIHSIVFCAIFLCYLTVVLVITRNEFLLNRASMLYLLMIGYTILIYYIMALLQIGYENKVKLISDISSKNEEIESKNNMLLNREQELEELTRELSSKNKSLNQLNVSKDKLFSIIGHDLKNHTSTLNGFLVLLLERVDILPLEKIRKYVTLASESGKSLYTLLTDLLDWSRNQSHESIYQPEIFDIYKLVENVIFYQKLNADVKKIKINNHIPENSNVCADYKMVFTILRNLVSNAIKFSYMKSEIDITSEDLFDKKRIHIIDHGVGISEANVNNLFSLEKTNSTPGTNEEQGSGLGLILCKQFAEENKGEIGVISEEKKGSDFWLTLPLFTNN